MNTVLMLTLCMPPAGVVLDLKVNTQKQSWCAIKQNGSSEALSQHKRTKLVTEDLSEVILTSSCYKLKAKDGDGAHSSHACTTLITPVKCSGLQCSS